MIINNRNDGQDLDLTELPTDEYPVLSESTVSLAQATAEPNDAADAPPETKNESAKAALSLTQIEAEVSRLHAKWQSIDSEFKEREGRIAELQEEIAERESTIARLTADVASGQVALQAADEYAASNDGEIAALIRERGARDDKIDALSQALAAAESRHKETLDKLALAEAETTRLNQLILQEQATAADITERNRQVLADHDALQAKLQDLEIYINGRHDRWAELNAALADHKDALRSKEETIKTREATIAGHDEEKRQLTASIRDLERQCSELSGRRKEREEAYDELQKRLASHLAQTEQLRGENAARTKETEQAAKRELDKQQLVESLERDIAQRDANIAALIAQVDLGKTAVGELAAAKADLRRRVDDLENRSTELARQVQALSEELRASQDGQRVAQQQLADRAAQLASSQELLNAKAREAERLLDERDAAQKESARIRAELDTLGAHASELGRLRADAITEAKQLKIALTARNERISVLETELRVKQATADLLERSVSRITDLGTRLAALDERVNGGKHEETPSAPHAGTEPQPTVVDDGRNQEVFDVGERTGIEAGRKFRLTVDGQTFDYPISKKQMTIGRGHGTDIRVASHFVSRVHATIRTNGTATIIEDAGSKNGLVVNAERVQRHALRDGDVITLGDDLNMRFVDATH